MDLGHYVGWALSAAGAVLVSAIAWVKWSAHQAFADKSELGEIRARLSELETRVEALPTAADFAELRILITQLAGKIDTQTAILNRVENVVTRHEDIIATAAARPR